MKTTIRTNLGRAFLLSLLALGVANAAVENLEKKDKEKDDNKPPIGCRNVGYKFELETLHLLPGENDGDSQSMFVVHNLLTQPVNLFQMRSDESSRSTYLNHVLGAREWGVLSTSEKLVRFICTVADKKSLYGKVVDCSQSLQVCEYTNVRYGLNNRGNFWLANSSTKGGASSAIVHYGIIPGN
ncbi:hypothetical protein BN59_01244 [Legionella massiliensis]|uniref:Enhanced entry protein EnhB n=1 Tax=Legionella massiliensis TaxID=1034943 RepID=A0A078KRD3_9GAMM|nr:hypothetical protein [Legionella massiliensis]CDZ76965.1 hypothetical protein BN59_01244 [Legionella massiliensis]CEE12703.1 hypothetical protein BN1094_01244 [Legionella massiliensis]